MKLAEALAAAVPASINALQSPHLSPEIRASLSAVLSIEIKLLSDRAVAPLMKVRKPKPVVIDPSATSITVAQAAARLGCGVTRIFDLLKSGALKRGKKVGRATMVTVDSIEAFTSGPAPKKKPAPKLKSGQRPVASEILRSLKKRP